MLKKRLLLIVWIIGLTLCTINIRDLSAYYNNYYNNFNNFNLSSIGGFSGGFYDIQVGIITVKGGVKISPK